MLRGIAVLPQRFPLFSAYFLIMALSVVLSGCVGLLVPPCGYMAPDGDAALDERAWSVAMPENAPSISQGFSPDSVPEDAETRGAELDKNPDHEGIDIIAAAGTPVLAAAPGTVIGSFFDPLYGNQVKIDHGRDEKGRAVQSRYLHLRQRMVRKNDRVSRGTQIGTLGRSGITAAGIAHLHFEVLRADIAGDRRMLPKNPHIFWANGPGAVTCFFPGNPWGEHFFFTTYPVPCREKRDMRCNGDGSERSFSVSFSCPGKENLF